MPRHKGSPRRRSETLPATNRSLAAYSRAVECLRLKTEEKLSYAAIAQRMGYASPGGAYQAIQALLKRLPQESVEEHRRMEAEKLNRYEKVLEDLIFGNPEKGIEPQDRMTARNVEVLVGKVMERRAKMLDLDAAEKHEHRIEAPRVIRYVRDERQTERVHQVQQILEADYEVLEDLERHHRSSEHREPLPLPGRDDSTPGSTDSGDGE